MDRDAWWSTVHGVVNSWTWLSRWTYTILNCASRGCCRDTLRKGLVSLVLVCCDCSLLFLQDSGTSSGGVLQLCTQFEHSLCKLMAQVLNQWGLHVVFQKKTQALPWSCLQESWVPLFTCLLTLATCTLEDVSYFLLVPLCRGIPESFFVIHWSTVIPSTVRSDYWL